ncbi:MerR family transcriptional regulator [Streptomyces albidoflavus]|uniref:MerR family transcriptional regulator n=1 Tax=Streptomyces albidoflavus TaxID=1886 RepID=UPI0033C7747E
MAWSTREMAELAGVSLRAVRHYHDIGLIEEPERRSNGYKQYGVSHLVRLLRIKRLTALGFSLSQIADMDDAPDSGPDPRDLRALDAELAATIERLQHARAEVGALLRGRAASDQLNELPADADELTRQSLAERLVPYVLGLRSRHPGLSDLASDAPRGRQHTAGTLGKAISDLYNPAQVDVMKRLAGLLSGVDAPR